MTTTATTAVQIPLIQPPSVLTTQKDPTTEQLEPAFPLQTEAWLTMQTIVQTALSFPPSAAAFTTLYGQFSQEGTVESAVTVLGNLSTTAAEYGDPTTLITQLAQFQQAGTAPVTIYGNAVWLAYQTFATAQQISALLKTGLGYIGTTTDPTTRLAELTELLTGTGGVNALATELQAQIASFSTKVGTYYTALNADLTGSGGLSDYLEQASNVLTEATTAVSSDATAIDNLTREIHHLNQEYIGFTVAASASPLFLFVPFLGIGFAVADATTFGVLATKVKAEMAGLQQVLAAKELDEQKKAALVAMLGGFNAATASVEADGTAFLSTLATMEAGWSEFSLQITTQLHSLTVDEVTDWSTFMDNVGFTDAMQGWDTIGTTAQSFFQTGFATFTTSTGSAS